MNSWVPVAHRARIIKSTEPFSHSHSSHVYSYANQLRVLFFLNYFIVVQLRVLKHGISFVLGWPGKHLREERTSGEPRATSLRGEPVCSRNPDARTTVKDGSSFGANQSIYFLVCYIQKSAGKELEIEDG